MSTGEARTKRKKGERDEEPAQREPRHDLNRKRKGLAGVRLGKRKKPTRQHTYHRNIGDIGHLKVQVRDVHGKHSKPPLEGTWGVPLREKSHTPKRKGGVPEKNKRDSHYGILLSAYPDRGAGWGEFRSQLFGRLDPLNVREKKKIGIEKRVC